ncbi:AraC family transcriptional regulator [Aliiglaciecola sp. LCG003]|uniref:AraC family transcriptional regulator n=1 Tax=Aliiglaciecola sp. LCG003 TaxID=3053655 RepID=UPI0025723460|nr:AraC family transcriptional regulator [Aliiglaciecola sp. LCG003]WJG10279.1 AraC family transcriptional regulator ligand-binding domain-containing protein [Aliiglaciecola sp. LCG003]
MDASVTQSFTWAIMRHIEQLDIPITSQLKQQINQYDGALRLPMALQDELWQSLAAENDPSLGLTIGLSMLPQSLDTMGFLLLSSPSLGVAVDSLVNYSSLVGEGGSFSKSHGKQGWKLSYEARFSAAVSLRIEAIMASIVAGARWVSGKDIAPVAVYFKHARQTDLALYNRVFNNAKVHFGQKQNAIVYADDDWNFKQREVNPVVQAQMLDLARQQLAQLKPQNFPAKVQALLIRQPWLSRSQLATSLAISERTLSRKLLAEGLSYQSISHDIRKQHALEQVTKPGTTQAGLADYLGYHDESAFAKAFKRWTGMGFRQYRQHHCS